MSALKMDVLAFYVIFAAVSLGVVIALLASAGRQTGKPRRHFREGGLQWELDLRLTYKRFRELYPYSKVTYEEYKRLQMQRAFRRAVSSMKNKRMVR